MRLWYLSHGRQRRLRWACASAQSRQSLHCSHTRSRQRVWPKIRHLAPLDGCAWVFEEWVYEDEKYHDLMRWFNQALLSADCDYFNSKPSWFETLESLCSGDRAESNLTLITEKRKIVILMQKKMVLECLKAIRLGYMSPVKQIRVFEHSVMTNFNCACPAIQRGQGSGFLSEGSSWFTACMSEQRRFWRDCADAQARLNLRCSHMR